MRKESGDKIIDNRSLRDTSKFIALILRHKQETIGITLDEHGWANVSELIDGICRTRPFDMEMLERIVAEGLKPKSRLYVHLSADVETAIKVGSRHGKPIVYMVEAGKMQKAGYRFYKSVNGIWLTKEVPVEFFRMVSKENAIVS